MFPDLAEGSLDAYRQALVQNQHLAELALVSFRNLFSPLFSVLNEFLSIFAAPRASQVFAIHSQCRFFLRLNVHIRTIGRIRGDPG